MESWVQCETDSSLDPPELFSVSNSGRMAAWPAQKEVKIGTKTVQVADHPIVRRARRTLLFSSKRPKQGKLPDWGVVLAYDPGMTQQCHSACSRMPIQLTQQSL